MKKVKMITTFLQWLIFLLLIPGALISFGMKWFGKTIPIYDTAAKGFSTTFFSGLSYYFDSSFHAPILARILGSFVDGISLVLFFIGIFFFVKLLRLYKNKEFFSLTVLNLYKKIMRIALIIVIYKPISRSLLSLITTFFHNPPGQRILTVSINSDDILNVFLFAFLYILFSIMCHGYELKKEQDLTV
ncbi:MAG: DUF2975 domain-containing protein [bacterium]